MEKYLGMQLDNRYEVMEVIGSGGMAVVYKAKDLRLNRFVALKVLKDDLAMDADFRRRFHTESQAVAMLSNPNIVAVYDVSKSDNVEYIVMELIEGITLKQYMNRKGQLSWKESLHFATQITKALSHAHSRGIIHRDIKPHNIMILKDGSVKVADFGIARLQSSQSTTLTQEALGSVHYISPEQAKGSAVDARTDIYSLGVVLYEMLTTKLPFEGESPVSVAIQHISSTPLNPRDLNPDIPKGLEAITMKAMSPDLEKRYQSADELLKDLEEFRKNPDMQIARTPAAMTVKKQPNAVKESGRVDVDNSRKKNSASDKKNGKKKSRKVSTLTGVFCVFALLIIIVAFLWFFILKDLFDTGDKYTVDDFTGKLYTDVINNEDYADIYDFELVEKETGDYDAHTVISQNPTAGREVTKDKNKPISVTLTYAVESTEVTMPDVTNEDYRQAKLDLNALNLNLTIEVEEIPDDSITKGYVVRTMPRTGSALEEGDTVTLYVSTGPAITTVEVPNVYGMKLSKAITALQNAGLTYKPVYEYSNVTSKDIVIGQNIDAGTEVNKNTEIVLTVSNGPSPSPSPSESPSPSPSESPSPSPSEVASPSPTTSEQVSEPPVSDSVEGDQNG